VFRNPRRERYAIASLALSTALWPSRARLSPAVTGMAIAVMATVNHDHHRRRLLNSPFHRDI
jgi:hypothetical protein